VVVVALITKLTTSALAIAIFVTNIILVFFIIKTVNIAVVGVLRINLQLTA
jgi:hypothetical protein